MLKKSCAEKEVKEKPKDSNGSVKLTGVTNDIAVKVTGFLCTASEKTKEPVYRITKSDSKNSETGGIREKLVDYTESSELEDETSENCQINVDHDFNTDHDNIKDPLLVVNYCQWMHNHHLIMMNKMRFPFPSWQCWKEIQKKR